MNESVGCKKEISIVVSGSVSYSQPPLQYKWILTSLIHLYFDIDSNEVQCWSCFGPQFNYGQSRAELEQCL